MAEATRKAYHVFDVNGEIHEIVFAETRGKAIYGSWAYAEYGDWTCVRARRAPEFDSYADAKSIPDEAYLAAGWSLECPGCWRRIWQENAVIVNGVAYCDQCAPNVYGRREAVGQ